MASPSEPGLSPDSGRDADILRERDRIAAELQNRVVQQLFATGLHLQSVVTMAVDPLVHRRVEQAIDDLDRVIQIIRDAVFDLGAYPRTRELRAGILYLSEQLSPVPHITFRGQVDDGLHPTTSAELLDILRDALAVIRARWFPVAIDVAAVDGAPVIILRAVPLPAVMAGGEGDDEFSGLRARAAQAGVRVEIESRPDLVQVSWHAV